MQPNKSLFFAIVGLAVIGVAGMFGAWYFLIKANPITLTVLYSTEKEAWLKDVVAEFEGQVGGRAIELELKQMGSLEMAQAVLDGVEQPDLISPASSLQVSILQEQSAAKYGLPLVNGAECRPVVNTPLVLVAWKERADVLWGNNPNGNMWQRLQEALIDPAGWAAYDRPEWGYIKFGHTDPTRSNSGLMTILLMTYGFMGKTSGLTSNDILSSPDFNRWFTELEGSISEFGSSTGTYMRDITTYGPSKYDIVAVYESSAIEQARNAVGRYGELQVYYPPATVMSDHPFCVVKAEWVSSDKAKAAEALVDYLLSRPVQEQALAYGFRPVDPTIAPDQAGSPFNQLATNGIQLNLPPEVEVPPGDVLDTLLRFWDRSTQ
jgi:ABC-type Fe3+ transport system substrate-binding protein